MQSLNQKTGMRSPIRALILVLSLLPLSFNGFSQCGCKFTIAPSASFTYFNGIASGVQPGDVICIQAGAKGGLQFTDVKGSATNPVIIKNCGGQALIGGPTANNAMLFIGSRYVRITGTGDPGFVNGLKIVGSAPGSQGIAAVGLSSDFEIDHMEIQNCGYTGMMLKSDPSSNCANTTSVRPNFTFYQAIIHDNYVHDTGGEGIYLGDSFYNGTTVFCGSIQYCHEVRGVRIYNNRFDKTGREGIQVGSGVDDVEVYNNVVLNYGQANLSAQNGGIQFGVGTAGRMYNNFIKSGPGPAIAVQGIGNDYVYNNIVVSPGEQAITINTRPTPLATDIVNKGWLGGVYVINNTFVNVGPKGVIEEFINNAPGNRLFNNLIVASSSPWDKTYTYTDWQRGNNVFIPLLANAKFVNPSIDDYRLMPGSPAINAGRDVSSFGVTFDFDNNARPAGATWDAGAFELAGNQKPIVTVGANQSINLPTNSTAISGSATDSDGTIASYLWSKQSGPSVTITNETTTTVTLTNLVIGVYVFRLTATDNGGETGFKDVTVTVADPSINQPPTTASGGNKTIALPINTTVLNGSASDADGTISSYAWTKISGPATFILANANTATLTLTGLVQGVYVFRLTATDNDGDIDTDDATVTVNPAAANQLPTANAGSNKSLVLPTNSTTLNGAGSDPDGTIATYLWTKQSGPGTGTLANQNTPNLQLTNLVAGSYVLRLTVTDNIGATAFAQATVTVTAANQAPTANAGGNKTIQLPTSSTTITGSGSDTDGTISSYLWTKQSGPAATLANANTAVLSLTGLVQGTYVFRLVVTDNNGATGSTTMTLSVQAANVAPTANAGSPKTITLPVNSTTLSGSGADTDGTITIYLWEKVSGGAATLGGSATPTLALTNLVVGSYVFRLTVTDNNGATGFNQVNVTVLPLATNQSPLVDAGTDITLTLPINSTNIFGFANDPDGTISSYLWSKISGPAATLSGTTLATLSVSNLVAGSYVFRLTATDNQGASASNDVNVVVSSANQPPTVVASNDEIITLPTSSTSLIAVASDPDGTISNYLWVNLSGPGAPTLSGATTNVLNVSALIAGTYVFKVTVTDNNGATASDQVNVIVQTSTNINPTANAGSDIAIFLPTNSVTLTGSGTDADGTIVLYGWTQVAGAAATLTNASTKTVSISGLAAGTYTFRLTVTDNGGGTGISDVNVTVNLSSTNQSPIANAGPDIALSLPNNSTNLIGSGSDADGTISSYSWIKLSGPTVTLSNDNTAVVSLEDLNAGVYVFRLTVIDNNGSMASDNTQVTVFPASVNQSPSVTAGNDKTITLPTNTTTLIATANDPDGTVTTYTWTKQVGPIATLTGAATSSLVLTDLVVGSYTFRITVSDNSGGSSFDEINVTVLSLGSNVPPVVNAGIDKILFLPTNSVNLAGQASDIDGTVVTYLWSKISGPPATITGQNTPTLSVSNMIAGQYNFRLTATDDLGDTNFDEALITIFPGTVNQAPIANAGTNRTIVLPNNSTTLSGSGFDPDGSIVSYAWTQILGPATTINNVNSPTVLITNLSLGVFQYRLTVQDDKGASGSSAAQIVVVAAGAPQPPIADAGFDQVINLPQTTAEIQGSGADADGSIATYSWAKTSGPAAGTLTGTGTSKLSLAALVSGTYQFTLTVTDNDNLTNSDEVKVTVISGAVNNNPTVNAGIDQFIRQPTNSTTLTAVASDIDGSISNYQWTKQSGPAVTIGANNSAALSLTNLVLGTYVFRIEVTDNQGASASDEITVTGLAPGANAAPIVLAGAPQTLAIPDISTVLNGSASDPDGSIKSIQWALTNGPNSPTLSGVNTTTLLAQNLVAGLYTFRLTATDNENAVAFSETTVNVIVGQLPPTVFAGNDTTLLLPDNFLSLNGSATTTNGFIADYQWEQIAGDPITLIVNYPAVSMSDMLPGVYTLRFTATDNFGTSASDDLTVTVTENKSNPVGATLIFSPNDDLVNDVWFVKNAILIQGCPLQIFNNLGQKVYEATDYQNDWNGLSNGQPVKEGDYYFVFDCGSKKNYSGALRLIR